MKYFLLVSLLFCVRTFAYGQYSETDYKVNERVKNLKSKNINKYFVYYVSCNGRIPKIVIEGQCTVYDVKYVFWLENGRSFLQRFDECNEYIAKPIRGGLFNTISKGLNEIDTAKILYPMLKVMRNGQFVLEHIIRDHTCSFAFKIHWGQKFIEKYVDQFNLSLEYSDEHQLNVNYQRNQKSILNKLVKQINGELIKVGYPQNRSQL